MGATPPSRCCALLICPSLAVPSLLLPLSFPVLYQIIVINHDTSDKKDVMLLVTLVLYSTATPVLGLQCNKQQYTIFVPLS